MICRSFSTPRLHHQEPRLGSSRTLPTVFTVRPQRRTRSSRMPSVDPDNTTILVAGGSGCALETVKVLKDMGPWTYMLQRTDKLREELEAMNVIVVKGDAMDKANLEAKLQNIDGLEAVVSTVGGTLEDYSVDSVGNINLIQAALKAKVKRFILVTSIGVGASKTSIPEKAYETLKLVLLEKEKAEEELKSHGNEMEFVIIRPGGLTKSQPATGGGVLTEDEDVGGIIHREDVAQLIVKALFSEKATNKVLHAIDKDSATNNLHPEKELQALDL